MTEKDLPSCLYPHLGEVEDIQLHWFSDASNAAYGGEVNLRARYIDIQRVIISKGWKKAGIAGLLHGTTGLPPEDPFEHIVNQLIV